MAVVSTPDPQHAESFKLLLGTAPRLGLELRNVLVSGQGDLDRIFTEIGRGRADAVLVQPSPFYTTGMEHLPTSATGTGGSARRGARCRVRRRSRSDGESRWLGQGPLDHLNLDSAVWGETGTADLIPAEIPAHPSGA